MGTCYTCCATPGEPHPPRFFVRRGCPNSLQAGIFMCEAGLKDAVTWDDPEQRKDVSSPALEAVTGEGTEIIQFPNHEDFMKSLARQHGVNFDGLYVLHDYSTGVMQVHKKLLAYGIEKEGSLSALGAAIEYDFANPPYPETPEGMPQKISNEKKARLWVAKGCPFVLQVLIFVIDARLLDRIEFVFDSPEERAFVKEKLGGVDASFPALELASGDIIQYPELGSIVRTLADAYGIDTSSLYLYNDYLYGVYPVCCKLFGYTAAKEGFAGVYEAIDYDPKNPFASSAPTGAT